MIGRRAKTRVLAASLAALGVLTGCQAGNLNSVTLPGGIATGSDGYRISAVFENTENLVPNSQVLYGDVPIGTVRAITLDGSWHAHVSMSLKRDVPLPSNVTATVGQKSLLGAEYVQLDQPAATPDTTAPLKAGAEIPLNRTAGYPETEAVLSAVSLLLNDGGLAQIKTITTQLNVALQGREGTVRDLFTRLDSFLASLDAQKQSIVSAVSALDRLSTTFAMQKNTISNALTQIPPGVLELNKERVHLTRALEALGHLGVVGTAVINASKNGLLANLAELKPTLKELDAAGSDLPKSLLVAGTFPFPLATLTNAFRGDYANLFVTLDLTLPSLQHNFLAQVPVVGGIPLGASLGGGNPLTNPLGATSSPGAVATRNPPSTPATSTPSSTPTTTPGPSKSPCPLLKQLLGGC